ncbi:hypothetical protein OB919_13455 [Halobacteria archaeon AArc-curdl1]|uniref:Uncharacterized protein n=1 Tax=Natronosalvus hydrolyticus TaxID=2979988 RepID=A0AAP2ZAE7_9EURY|nr:hypothetical protein [Halobacteria archaeon AArc-curdl1]
MSDEDSASSSSEQGRRIGSWGVPGGAVPVLEEDIPDDLEVDAVYWYGRYRELEKSYMDLGQQLEHFKNEQKGRHFMLESSQSYEFEKTVTRVRNWVGLFFGTITLLGAASIQGFLELPPYLIATAAFAFTAIFDAISLPGLLGRIWRRVF